LVVGWLILRGHQANFYDTNFAFSLMSISLVAILLGLILLNAGTLNRVDYDRIRSDDRIRSSEERLQLALEGANQGIWDLDSQTQILTWDDRCKAIFGLLPAAVITYAKRLHMIHPDDRQQVTEAMAIAARQGGEFVKEYRTIYPNGTRSAGYSPKDAVTMMPQGHRSESWER
jgi:PAS domain S-box-containing protein